MIIVGSFALALRGLRAMGDVRDLDLIGTREEAETLKAWLGPRVLDEQDRDQHLTLAFMSGPNRTKIEFDYSQLPSDRMLDRLCHQQVKMLDHVVKVPPLEVLYLIKRAHANRPVHFDKTLRDLLLLKPKIGALTEEQQAFGLQRKAECIALYANHRTRFAPAIREEDTFDAAASGRLYVHGDVHQAIAAPGTVSPGACCTALNTADSGLAQSLQALSSAQLMHAVREAFMVTGIERYYVRDTSLEAAQVYRLGMHKTIRDVFTGELQDFCIDHLDQLMQPPAQDFVDRFASALAQGKVRQAQRPAVSTGIGHEQIWTAIQQGRLNEARRLAEDKVRRCGVASDPHSGFMLGAIFQMTGFLPQAELCLRASLAQLPEHATAWMHLGLVMLQTGRERDALDALEAARQLGTQEAALFVALGMAYEETNQFAQALQAYQQAYALNPEHPQARSRLASAIQHGSRS